MGEYYPFFLVIFVAVLFSVIFKRFNVPWVITLILGGISIGPHGFNLLPESTVLDFIGNIGLIFLMFMAGLEVRLSTFKDSTKKVMTVAFFNGGIPFIVGLGIGYFVGFNLVQSLLLGIVFISSSIAVLIPTLETTGLIHKPIGKSIIASTIMEDMTSLLLLSILLRSVDPLTSLPLPIFLIILITSLMTMRWILPKIQWFFSDNKSKGDPFQQELRIVFFMLVGTVVIFELIGLHPIIAGFFAGVVLSGNIGSAKLKEQLHVLSYGLFIPTFFVILGAKTDISVFLNAGPTLTFTTIVLGGLIVSKIFGGWFGGRLAGFSKKESLFIGYATIPQLSTTLAVAFTAVELGIFESSIIPTMVMMSIVTVFLAPLLTRKMVPQLEHGN
ncbi:hypothetical protein COW81_02405 [Candidatus Campbellbacteria bacterium CG22_combo_CG10-13_8_21_14_all_36_13]|uniref:Cation/H+ exchanger transmembrane domain-containing protein n=1 Tax=Candidatus Campbellbacteria bacterium CG22_combo_CG10-13_8_21_14_all_36_13 TaxID=1974529 RepID=A0A2H0DYF9_9BACT|nr:MAG: hypothetical protein COW81_02405 [Candidatus Campbellbacteria bacterium CG22_combo_CG10-13_8_21_14_all_36_13]